MGGHRVVPLVLLQQACAVAWGAQSAEGLQLQHLPDTLQAMVGVKCSSGSPN